MLHCLDGANGGKGGTAGGAGGPLTGGIIVTSTNGAINTGSTFEANGGAGGVCLGLLAAYGNFWNQRPFVSFTLCARIGSDPI